VWINGTTIAQVGGAYAWRTRISECRRSPFNLNIANRQRRVRRTDGRTYIISEYRFISDERSTREGATAGASTLTVAGVERELRLN